MRLDKTAQDLRSDFSKLIKKTSRKAKPGDVHDLRITIRKLQACLWLGHRAGSLHKHKNLKKGFERLNKALGACRRFDVLLKDATNLGLDLSSLKKKQKRQQKELQTELQKDFVEELKNELQKFTEEYKKHPTIEQDVALLFADAHLSVWPDRVPDDKEVFHKLRIATKKMNYRLALMSIENPAADIQKAMGRAHDYEELIKEFPQSSAVVRGTAQSLKNAHRTYISCRHQLEILFKTLE